METSKTAAEMEIAVDCERNACLDSTMAPVTIQAGDTEQQWCATCVESEFGLKPSEYGETQKSVFQLITPATVGAFCLGLTLMLLVASVAVV